MRAAYRSQACMIPEHEYDILKGKLFMKRIAGIVGMVLSVLFVILAFSTVIPDKYISSYGADRMLEYVGGDAYNFIIEASLRGGEIAGAKTARAVYFAASAVLTVISLYFLAPDPADTLHNDLGGIKNALGSRNASSGGSGDASSYTPVDADAVPGLNEWKCVCGKTNPNTASLCWFCRRDKSESAALKKVCPNCGAENKSANTVCFACNQPLE